MATCPTPCACIVVDEAAGHWQAPCGVCYCIVLIAALAVLCRLWCRPTGSARATAGRSTPTSSTLSQVHAVHALHGVRALPDGHALPAGLALPAVCSAWVVYASRHSGAHTRLCPCRSRAVDPPFVPADNPTGCYRLQFEAPAEVGAQRCAVAAGCKPCFLLFFLEAAGCYRLFKTPFSHAQCVAGV